MTEKRYFLHKHLIKNDVIHDKICHKWLKGEELESDMNTLYNKYSFLKKENEQLKIRFKEERDTAMRLGNKCDDLTIKNQKLKLEIIRLEMIIKTGKGGLND